MNHETTVDVVVVVNMGGAELAYDVELPVVVDFDYKPGTPDVMYMSNGDPGYEGDPAEVEVNGIYPDGDTRIELAEGIVLTISAKTEIGKWLPNSEALRIDEMLYEVGEEKIEDAKNQALEDRAFDEWQEREWRMA